MKNLLSILLLIITSIGYSQYYPYLGPNQYLSYGVDSTILTADLSQYPTGNNPNQTTNYDVISIPFTPQTNTGNTISFPSDNSQLGPFPIGFNFCFFGQTYNQFWVSSDGWISFTPQSFSAESNTNILPLPAPNLHIARNCIMGAFQNWNAPGFGDYDEWSGGQVKYQLSGISPCKKLTVSWIEIPLFYCNNTQGTFHIVIYESTNEIENYIQNKPYCNWEGGLAIQGINNLLGNETVTVPGRNATVWTALNDAKKYIPSGPPIIPSLVWYQVGNPTPIASGISTITINPPPGGANYTCHLEYPICNAGWNVCNPNFSLGFDTVFIISELNIAQNPELNIAQDSELVYYIPNTFTPNGDEFNQTFKPLFSNSIDPYNYSFYIYNRWGHVIFETHDIEKGWDGSYQNNIYNYIIIFKDNITNKNHLLQGLITIL